MIVVMVALAPCKSCCRFSIYLFRMAMFTQLPNYHGNKIAKSEEDLLDLIFLGRILKP